MIVAFTIPAMGHVKPMLPLLSGLTSNGKKVICYGHRKFEQIIRATGADFAPYPDIAYNIDAPDFNLVKMSADLINASQIIYPELLPQVRKLAPELILQDSMALWASRIGSDLCLPRIHTIPTLVFNKTAEREMRREDGLAKLAKDALLGVPALIDAQIKSKFSITMREAFGLEHGWYRLQPPACELVFCIRELQVGRPYGKTPRHYIGPTYLQKEKPPQHRSKNTALISFGTLSNNETERFAAAMQGAFLAGFSVIAQTGSKVNCKHLQEVAHSLQASNPSQTVQIVETVPDLEDLIAGADIVIHHAGMATTWETVRHRKPALFIPTIADQKVLAGQLEKLGLGIRLPAGKECNATAIASALRTTAKRNYHWQKVETLLAAAGGAATGTKIIVEFLESQK